MRYPEKWDERGMTTMRGGKNILNLALALGLLIYAMPRLEVGQGLTPPTLFSVAWIAMALLIIAAHLRAALAVDGEEPSEGVMIERGQQ